jgi:hypothetical protein
VADQSGEPVPPAERKVHGLMRSLEEAVANAKATRAGVPLAEAEADQAPVWYGAAEASAWASGYNAARRDLAALSGGEGRAAE